MPIRKRPLKIVCVGGGSYRLLPILRGVFAVRPVLDGGEVRLVDRVLPRAEAVGRLLMRTPEYHNLNCKVTWSDDLDRALADALFVYPVQFNTRNARRLACELLDIHRPEIPTWCQETKRWLAGPIMGDPGK